MIVIPNEKLLAVAQDAGFFESFRVADDVLRQGVQGISDIITIPGIINRDFADVKTTMAGMGYAVMGTAQRSGENRAIAAAQAAMASPLLEDGAIDGARGILINISGSSSLKLSEVNAASTLIQSAAHEDANIIFGAVLDETMGDDVKITVIATGFRQSAAEERERAAAAKPAVAGGRSVAPAAAPAPAAKPRFASEVEESFLTTAGGAGASPAPGGVKSLAEQEIFLPREAAAPDSTPFFVDEVREPARQDSFGDRFASPARYHSEFESNGMDRDAGQEDDLEIPAYLRRAGN